MLTKADRKRTNAFLVLFIGLILTGTIAIKATAGEPPKYKMELVMIFEEDKPVQYIFVLNGSVGFKSVEALKKFVVKRPSGTVIEWRPSCLVMEDQPFRTEKEIADFRAFCKSNNINFILLPSG